MSTVVNFKGKRIIEPGVYAQVQSGIPVKPGAFSSGNVAIVDTGFSGSDFGGGSGINGVHAQGLNSVYSFQDVNDFKDFVRGGLLYDVADLLFNPENGASGPETVFLMRAATTTPAKIDFNFTGSPAGTGAVGTAVLTAAVVTSITVTSGGTGYVAPPTVNITGGGGTGATATAVITGGVVTSFVVTSGGTGYTSVPTVALTSTVGADGGSISFICLNEGQSGNGYTDEILSQATVKVAGPISIGATEQLQVNQGAGFAAIMSVVTATTTSPNDFKTLIIDAINTNAAGFTARLQGGDIIIKAKRITGASANGWPLNAVTTGTVTVTVPPAGFLGGIDGVIVATGYAAQMMPGVDDPSKFMIEFYEGTYRGQSEGGNDIGGLTPSQSNPNLIATSVEFNNIDDLITWAKSDFLFAKRFVLDANWREVGTGAVSTTDLANYSNLNLANSGTTAYGPGDLDRTLTDVRELDNTFFLCDRYGDAAMSAQNQKIFDHIKNTAEMDKFMFVGGGIDETKFEDGIVNSSISIAKFYNDQRVHIVHSGNKRPNVIGGGFEKLTSFHYTANVVGRLGGLEPQTPLTFKAVKTQNFNHQLGLRERERALQAGVIHNRFVPGIGNVINQGINSLQRNTQLINPDGTSFEISIMRIAAQLNKELVLNMRPLFVGNSAGQASPADVKSFVEGYLFSRTATTNKDNLILSFKNVSVRLIEDYYDIKYGFVPNGPINKLFLTGFMLDNNLSA